MAEETGTTSIEALDRKVQSLDKAVDALSRQVAGAEVAGWDTRIEQLRLEAALGKMEVEDELGDRIERVRSALEAARRELEQVPSLVGEAFENVPDRLRPAFDQIEKAYREAKKAIG